MITYLIKNDKNEYLYFADSDRENAYNALSEAKKKDKKYKKYNVYFMVHKNLNQ